MYNQIKQLVISKVEDILQIKLNENLDTNVFNNFDLNPLLSYKYPKRWCENKTFVFSDVKYLEHKDPREKTAEIRLYVSEYKKNGEIKNVKMYVTSFFINSNDELTIGENY